MFQDRIYNFSAGPSMLPLEVLEQAQKDLLNYGGTGTSVMEMSHRSAAFDDILKQTEADFREVMKIPDNYKVLFLQGGATLEFAAIPMNLLKTGVADYVRTGQFSTKCYKEALRFSDKIHLAASSDEKKYSYIPQQEQLDLTPGADYLHICYNNTVFGTKWNYIPETGDVPIVADMSSFILSEPVDVSKFGVIYAGVQKNIAPAGMAVVIVREDLLTGLEGKYPTYMDWKAQAEAGSIMNTPPCWCIYMCGLVLKWIKANGGLEARKAYNDKKAAVLYDFLDQSKMFKSAIEPKYRSMMNVTFVTGSDELDKKFVAEATTAGFVNLKGHRSVGGMRASIYNAMPMEGVEKLVAFMKKFEEENS